MKRLIIGMAMVAAATTEYSLAASTQCPDFFFNGQAPDVINQKLSVQARPLCNTSFAVLHSGVTKTGLYSAELLTPEGLKQAKGLKRKNAFHADERIPANERAELRDYVGSKMDKGHETPSADAGSPEAQFDTFALSNMMPQFPENNRGVWEGVESAVRHLVQTKGQLYVITGPLFEGSNLRRIGGRVLVPTSIYKAVYDPARRQGAAYVTVNGPGHDWQVVSLAEIEKRAGMNLFPSVPARVKAAPMSLPAPMEHGYAEKSNYRAVRSTSDVPSVPSIRGLIGAMKYFSHR